MRSLEPSQNGSDGARAVPAFISAGKVDPSLPVVSSSIQVKQQHLRFAFAGQFQFRFVAHGRGIAAVERFAVQCHLAFGDVNPGMALRLEFVRHRLAVAELREPQIGVLVDADAAVAARFAGDQMQPSRRGVRHTTFRRRPVWPRICPAGSRFAADAPLRPWTD